MRHDSKWIKSIADGCNKYEGKRKTCSDPECKEPVMERALPTCDPEKATVTFNGEKIQISPNQATFTSGKKG